VTAGAADPTNAWLRRFGETLLARAPKGILCVSSRFIAPVFSVTTSEAPPLLVEPDVAPSPDFLPAGSVPLARRVIEQLFHAGLKASAEPARGLDVGAWLPLSLLVGAKAVPVVQLSLHASLDPEIHFSAGRALETLRDEGFVILGSGGLTNDQDGGEVLGAPSVRFQSWVTDLVVNAAPYGRARGLTRFRDHPDAHRVHRTGEQFLPLLVVAGAASKDMSTGNVGLQVHAGCQRGLSQAAFLFER
jgi:aromatic ring-opening dioxygenase catalytic subunit (LigB family)